MNVDQPQHIIEEDLESYSMAARIPGLKLAEMEEHLLVCALCRQQLEESDAYVATMRGTLRLLDARERQRSS